MTATDEALITAIAVSALPWLPTLIALGAARKISRSRTQADKGDSGPALSGLLLCGFGFFVFMAMVGPPRDIAEVSRNVIHPELLGQHWYTAYYLGTVLSMFATIPLMLFGYCFFLDALNAAQTWRLLAPGAPHPGDITNGILLQRDHRRCIAEESLAAALADRHVKVFGDRQVESGPQTQSPKTSSAARVLVDVTPSTSGTTTRFSFTDSSDRTQDILAELATAVNEAEIIRSATTTTDASSRPALVIEWDDTALYSPTTEFEYSYQYPYEPLIDRIKAAIQPESRTEARAAVRAWFNSLSQPTQRRVEATPAGLDNIPFKSNLAITMAAIGGSAQRPIPGSCARPATMPTGQPA